MNKNYRGDTFWRTYEVEYENEPYIFKKGDYIKVAFFSLSEEEFLPKKIEATDGLTKIDVTWSKEEMATLKNQSYFLECDVTTSDFRKTYRETIDITNDYIITNEEAE